VWHLREAIDADRYGTMRRVMVDRHLVVRGQGR
jgi:hypothetical protein